MIAVSDETRNIYEQLYAQASLLTFNWLTYRKLFVADQQQIDLLDRTGRSFFQVYHDMVLSDVILSLTRLTDDPKSDKGARVSLGRLMLHLPSGVDVQVNGALKAKIEQAVQQCAPFRPYRNTLIAHVNLNVALDPSLSSLPDISIDQIDAAVKKIQQALTFYSESVFNESHLFDPIQAIRDASSVLLYLSQGWKCLDERHQAKLRK